jgi:cyclase
MNLTDHLRILRPHPGLLAFYDGRVEGFRFAPEPNWVDEGALSLGIASYALISGTEALVYDTQVSVPHARAIRDVLDSLGVRRITVVLSHCHLDHVAGTEAFADCEIIANRRTAEHLAARPGGDRGGHIGWPAGHRTSDPADAAVRGGDAGAGGRPGGPADRGEHPFG